MRLMDAETEARAEAVRLLAAGEAAFSATLWDEAVEAYERALAIASEHGAATGVDEAAVLTRLGSCYWSMSQARTGWRTLRRAMGLYRDRGDGVGLARATVEVLRIWGPWERQRAMADEALEALDGRWTTGDGGRTSATGGDGAAGVKNHPEDRETAYLRARLLIATSWRGQDDRWAEALRIGDQWGFRDITASRLEDQSWQVYRDSGDLESSVRLAEEAFEAYVSTGAHERACQVLRGIGFTGFEVGDLARGVELARRCVEYARSVHLKFHEELALTDWAGEAFARADYVRCHAILDQLTTNTDFRADLYRMWIVERSGDTKRAVQMMVDPERAGRAATGMSQTHGAAAGVMYRAGLLEPATREMEEWATIAIDGQGGHDLAIEAPVLFECIAALGTDDLVRRVCASYEVQEPGGPRIPLFATLSGRACAPAHGALLVRLGRLDDAERAYADGLALCERERMPVDAGLCLSGLAEVWSARGDAATAATYRARARSAWEVCGARLYLDRLG